ncbi:hypothetical protein Tco_0437727 [Tanacetum coccineum]
MDVIFLWKEERLRLLADSVHRFNAYKFFAMTSNTSKLFSRTSRYAPGLGNEECSNCKFFSGKIKVLDPTLELEMHPENHTLDSSALLHELYNDMGKFGLE